MIIPTSHDRLVRALTDGYLGKPIKIGPLSSAQLTAFNEIREMKGWTPITDPMVTIGPAALEHMLKRIQCDGMTPEEVASLVGYSLEEGSEMTVGKMNRATLVHPNEVPIDSASMRPQAVFIDGENYTNPRLYGVIPKGWKGRKTGKKTPPARAE